MTVAQAYHALYSFALIVVSALLAVMLVRSAQGPGVTDRLLSINMIGTLVNVSIVLLSALLGEPWLIDVALIYTMISLGAVLVLARVYIPEKPRRKPFREEEGAKKERRDRPGNKPVSAEPAQGKEAGQHG